MMRAYEEYTYVVAVQPGGPLTPERVHEACTAIRRSRAPSPPLIVRCSFAEWQDFPELAYAQSPHHNFETRDYGFDYRGIQYHIGGERKTSWTLETEARVERKPLP